MLFVTVKCSLFSGKFDEIFGGYFIISLTSNGWPFHALLDIGLIRTTTGIRVFGALKAGKVTHIAQRAKVSQPSA
ncbi:hypothetical protein L6452_20613 [Arctium lappa]|uniref:Uncharacterized protein n=1 Tax=Arctium lappa TaxID=4217 RepID=A0ACB9BD70_ARCLA|nr:hypothetical protein L6452_20613 [Arctium lappa]